MEIDRLQLANFGNLELLAKQVVEGFITGMHKSPFHGFSVEFAEHRLYNSGESTRHIDWKLYGRTEKMFSKKYEEETNLRCQIVLDNSGSMYYPLDGLSKFEFSVYTAASIIELLRKQRDAVGLSIFNESLELNTESKSSISHHRFLFSELESRLRTYSKDLQTTTNTISILHDIAEITKRRSLVILFTDFLDEPDNLDEMFNALHHLRHNKHEVIIFQVISKKSEIDFNFENRPYRLVDMETGEKIQLNPSEIKDVYKKKINQYFKEIEIRCAASKIDFMPAYIEEGFNQVLLKFLLKRQKLN